ncbi:hypothetical protein [Pseudonocardia sp. NPDC046786]|uniref:hypothetical protein n=1 Tax=Pseudonocardia sp. NPDC046786 TaxID=3155471 RepID=UPI0033DC22C2
MTGGATMDIATILLLLLGGVGGFFVGRWSAETRRAHFDRNAVWNNRKRYRDG